MQNKRPDQKLGVLLVNLGTPDAPDQVSIRRYLKEFLSDPRVVEVPRLIWWAVLNLVILRFRPKKLVPDYQKIWQGEQSPLRKITHGQVTKLQEVLDTNFGQDKVLVKPAMTYGKPSFDAAFAEMDAEGVEKILVLPLYPQYSATTTAASYDAMSRALAKIRNIPEIRFIKRYHNHEKYIQLCIESIINQTYPEIELLVIDDGSSDTSPAILKKLSEQHGFDLVLQKNKGLSTTLNEAIARAKGKYGELIRHDRRRCTQYIRTAFGNFNLPLHAPVKLVYRPT